MKLLIRLLVNLLVNIIAIYVTTFILEAISVEGDFWGWVLVGAVFGLVNTFIRPLIKLLALPITVVTLGLFTLVINALMLIITSWLTPLQISGGFLETILWAIVGSIIISIVSTILNWILPD